ncbi:MAG: DUF3857 domain-containing protein [Prevotella sp.]|nr:DUF3857 domain-containing protein [Prevotella sp.]
MKLTLFKLFVLLAWPFATASAADVNLKFGKPTKEEMQMTTYEADPEAEAVVLCRLTDVEYTVQLSGYLVDYREKFRIKVLKPDGAQYARFVIPYNKNMSASSIGGSKFSLRALSINMGTMSTSFDGAGGSMTEDALGNYTDESIEDLKAVAYNQEGSKVVKSSLKKGDVKNVKIDDQHYRMEFTVPDVKVGTVIECEYTIHSELFWQLRDWYAQCAIPVAYAKLDMNIPNYLLFNIEEQGIQRLQCTCTTGMMRYKLESDPLAAPVMVNTNHYVCVGSNFAAIPKLDGMWNVNDYCAGITAELRRYSLRGTMQMDYAKTWDQVDQMILDSDDLGKRLSDHSLLADELKAAGVQNVADQRKRVEQVVQMVMSRVKWNGKYELTPASPAETLKKGEGSNADINLLIIQSLRDAGLTATPVLLRTRDLGQMPYNFPSIRKISTFAVGILLPGGGKGYLDASSATGQINDLPKVMLVERARLIQKGRKGEFVNLQKL